MAPARRAGSSTFYEGRLKKTQDWQRIEVVFNSLDESAVNVYAGLWGGRSGTLWLDDLALDELGLVNVLRRAGCPLVVTAADGKTVYEEGKDFLPVRDVRLGQDPYAGEYSFRHAAPSLQLTASSRIKDGQPAPELVSSRPRPRRPGLLLSERSEGVRSTARPGPPRQ